MHIEDCVTPQKTRKQANPIKNHPRSSSMYENLNCLLFCLFSCIFIVELPYDLSVSPTRLSDGWSFGLFVIIS